MKTTSIVSLVTVFSLSAFVTSCADPLTKSMKNLGYRTAIPTPVQSNIGDIYTTPDYRRPYMQLRHHFTKAEIRKIMEPLRMDVAVPNSEGEASYKISTSADVISYVKADLEASGARKFKVIYSGVNEYVVPETYFEDIVYPQIKAKAPARDFKNKYVVTGLLQVGSLEYEFFKENGTKIDINPGSKLAKDLTAKLGAEWKINSKKNLSFSQPRFLGYRMGVLTERTFTPKIYGPSFSASPPATQVTVRELSRSEMMRLSSATN